MSPRQQKRRGATRQHEKGGIPFENHRTRQCPAGTWNQNESLTLADAVSPVDETGHPQLACALRRGVASDASWEPIQVYSPRPLLRLMCAVLDGGGQSRRHVKLREQFPGAWSSCVDGEVSKGRWTNYDAFARRRVAVSYPLVHDGTCNSRVRTSGSANSSFPSVTGRLISLIRRWLEINILLVNLCPCILHIFRGYTCTRAKMHQPVLLACVLVVSFVLYSFCRVRLRIFVFAFDRTLWLVADFTMNAYRQFSKLINMVSLKYQVHICYVALIFR